jgi:phosphoribosylaminoimidazole (AIR) synthetase
MYLVFNLGFGLALVVKAAGAPELARQLKGRIIGKIVSGDGTVHLR